MAELGLGGAQVVLQAESAGQDGGGARGLLFVQAVAREPDGLRGILGRERALAARAAGRDPDKTTRGNDECWRGLPIPGLAEYYQSAFKLSRDSGVQHILALHRLSDLRSAGDDGSRQQRLAQGLLAEAATTVIYRQHAQEVPDTAEALGLSSTARERIARLPPGVALWCVGGRCFEVRHILSDQEWALIDTDQAMGARRQTTPPESDEGQLETAASVAP